MLTPCMTLFRVQTRPLMPCPFLHHMDHTHREDDVDDIYKVRIPGVG